MLVKINAKNATVYGKELAIMEKKIEQRFSRYFSESDEVTFSVKIKEEKIGFKVELTLPYYGYQLRAEASDKVGVIAAFDSAIDIMERRMAKHKDKLLSKKRSADVPVAAELPVEDQYELVRTKTYEMKPMSVQDAILNMEVLGHEFYMFNNSEEGKICTVYRRKDGAYGMIVPQ